MSDSVYDLVTIGAGSGGVRASRIASQVYGKKVACIELPFGWVPSEEVGGAGGTCVIRGCVPKKLLVYGSHIADELKDASGFGWNIGPGTHDWGTLVQNKGKEIQRLNGVYNNIMKNAGVEFIEGRGKIVDPSTVEVSLINGEKKQLKTKNILLATGGVATKLNIPGKEHCITSDEALSLETVPKGPIVVLGSGYIATEFAGIFNGLASEAHLMYRADKVLRGFDEQCREHLTDCLAKRGIHLHPLCVPTGVEKKGDDAYILHYKDGSGQEKSMECSLVMMATGRSPRTHNLGVQEVGIQLGPAGAVLVDKYSRTNVPGIWAIGDVTNRVNLTPVALMEGMALTKSAFGGELTAPDYEYIASAVFTQPPLATVGYTEEEAVKKLSGDMDVFVSTFRPMKYTLSGRDEKTLMKMIVHVESDQVVGVHMVGPDGPEIIQGIAIAMKGHATKKQFDSTVGLHPSAAEEFVTMRTPTRRITGQGSIKPGSA